MNQQIFKIWFLISYPFKSFANHVNKLDKPRAVLKMFIVITLCFFFEKNLRAGLLWLKPSFSPMFYVMLGFTILVYIWKHTDKESGELWKKEYALYQARKELKKQ